MHQISLFAIVLLLGPAIAHTEHHAHSPLNLEPFEVHYGESIGHLISLSRQTTLPDGPLYSSLLDSAGINLDVLKALKSGWESSFDWQQEQREINSLKQYTVTIEGLRTHFVHERSSDPDAIPLLLAHGWPGSFLEFAPVIKSLTEVATTMDGSKTVSFNVVVPSLPGFAFSEPPPQSWTAKDTGRLWNTLMTSVLGYQEYAVHGTDYGSGPTYSMYETFNRTVRAAHFNFLPFLPLSPDQLSAQNISLTPEDRVALPNFIEWSVNGSAYLQLQSTKPNTIGLALYDNPIGQLSWIAEKFIAWSDPRQGTDPSVLTHKEILRSVSLYYLSRSFLSSVFIYFQNRGFRTAYSKPPTDAPMLFSAFRYNVGFWPRALVAKIGNLVYYQNHDFGGHFPGLDNPPALIQDIREIASYW